MAVKQKFILLLIAILLPANMWIGGKLLKRLYPSVPAEPKSPAYEARANMLAELAKQLDAEVVFAGDSLTFFCPLNDFFPGKNVQNCGILSDTSTGLVKRWDATVASFNPRHVFILIGINDILSESDTDIASELEPILQKTPPGSIYLQSILPVAGKPAKLIPRIRSVNKELARTAKENGQFFLDIHSALAGPDGKLKAEYTYDGIHLTYSGYQAWKSAILKELNTLRRPQSTVPESGGAAESPL